MHHDKAKSGERVSDNQLGDVKATVGLFRQNANLLETEIKAISEIIKNSYDADATNVILNLKDAFKPKAQNPQILIKDNGHGMSLEDFNKKWFIVGKSVNTQEMYSPNNRIRQGGMGLAHLRNSLTARLRRATSASYEVFFISPLRAATSLKSGFKPML